MSLCDMKIKRQFIGFFFISKEYLQKQPPKLFCKKRGS